MPEPAPTSAPPTRGRWREELLAAAGYLALTLVLTWPLAAHLSTRIGGDHGDHWQTLWGFWHVREALLGGESLFSTDRLHHPHGIPLVHQTFVLPAALLWLPLSPLGELLAFNLVVLAAFVASGVTARLVARELGVSPAPAFLAGALYTFSPFHFGHALGHLHLVQMELLPLGVFLALRTIRGGGPLAAAGAGLAVAGAGYASPYFLLFAAVLAPILAAGLIFSSEDRPRLLRPRTLAHLGLAVTVAVVVLAPWLVSLLRASRAESWDGAHDPLVFSADLQLAFWPNDAQRLSSVFPHPRWSGNPAENANYLGYLTLLLAVTGAVARPRARAFVVAAIVGTVLSLGPRLRVGGRLTEVELPYAWLTEALPFLAWSGVPVRFGWLATFGLAVAAGLGLEVLWRAFLPRGRAFSALALLPGVLALAEYAPRPYVTSSFPAPAILRAWKSAPTPFAVLDGSGWTRPLWHGVLHGKPQLGGYTTRQPARHNRFLEETPLVRQVLSFSPAVARERTGLPREELLRVLRELDVRYVILARGRYVPAVTEEALLPIVWEGDGLVIHEVPAD